MRYFFFICLITIATLGYAPVPASAADTLTGEMAGRNFLLGGAWSCTTDVPAIMGMPAIRESAQVTFDVAPGNVLHASIDADDEHADHYIGYSTRFHNYWDVAASSHAIHSFGTSTDGLTFTGTSYLGTGSMNDSTTYTKVSATQTTLREVLSHDGQAYTIDTTCTRAS